VIEAPSRGSARTGNAHRRTLLTVAEAVALAVAAGVVVAVYLAPYVSNRFRAPIGYDLPKYLWRTNLVAARGIQALPGSAPSPFRVNADRPGLPVLWSLLSSWLRVSTVRTAIAFPAVAAAVIGLGAAGLAGSALRQPRWAVPVFAVVTGASINVSRMAGPGYDDNLLVSTLLVAAGALTLLAASAPRAGPVPDERHRPRGPAAPDAMAGPGAMAVPAWRPTAGAMALLAAATLVHWNFVVLFALVLAAVGVLALPGSLRDRHGPGGLAATPSGRIGVVLGGGAVLGALLLKALASGEPSAPRLPREGFLLKLGRDVPRYRFALTGPVAAIGAAWLARSRAGVPEAGSRDRTSADRARRLGLGFLVVWAAAGGAAVALLRLGASLPAHRFLAFGLGFPMLMAAGVVAVAEVVARAGSRGPNAVRAGAALVAAALALGGVAGGVWLAGRAWTGAHPWLPARQFEQAAAAGRYLERIGGDRPVVFLVDMGGGSPLSSTTLAFHVLRTALPAAELPRTLVYLGDPERYLRGLPTTRPSPATFDQASLRHFPSVRAALPRHPVALMMPAFHRGFGAAVAAHPEWRVGPALAVVSGPRPGGAGTAGGTAGTAGGTAGTAGGTAGTAGVAEAGPGLPPAASGARLATLAVAVLAVLAALGGGWAAVLVPARGLDRAALAPALGVAVAALAGVVAGRLGSTGAGPFATALVLGLAAAGWALAVASRVRRHRSG
jgi:hypothetical protein